MNHLRALSLPAAALLLASGAAALSTGGAVSATPRPTARTAVHATTTHLSKARLRASTSRLPRSAVHNGGGAVNLTENGRLQRFANRSLSPRPKVVRSVRGARVLASGATPSWLPVVSPSPVATTTPRAGAGWAGLDEADNAKYAGFSLEPPDQGLCAGAGHVFEMINDVVRVYTPNGAAQGTAYLNDFLQEAAYQFSTDPSCVWDAGSRRFYATSLILDVDPATGDLTGKTWLDLAVSQTRDPRGGWNIYRIPTTDDGTDGTPAHPDCPCLGDFPHLGTDAHGVFLTTNEYPLSSGPGLFGNNFNGAQVYALSKSRVASGASAVSVVHYENLRVPGTSGPVVAGFTLWPAQAPGTGYATARHGTMYFVSSMAAEEARPTDFTGHASQVGLWWLSNTASLDSAKGRPPLGEHTVDVGSYGIPPLSNQKPGPVPLRDCIVAQCVDGLGGPYTPEQEGGLDSSDTRPLTAAYVNGSVISALDTAMQVDGNLQAGFEWFRISAAGQRSSTADDGYVGVSQGNAIYPAIATNQRGRGYVGFTVSGANWYPSAGYATWRSGPGSTLHLAGVGAAPEDGFCEYLAFNCAGTETPMIRPRWGDYGYAAWDGRRFFVANEYIANGCSYSEFVQDFTCGGTRTFYGNFSTHIQTLF
jgi:hypothetical protein